MKQFKLFLSAILSLALLSCGNKELSVIYQDGDEFTVQTIEGVEMLFKIISVSDSTVQVGNGQEHDAAIDTLFRGQVTIPSNVKGFKVIRIANHAFEKCELSSVIIPEGVTVIKEKAYSNCEKLTKVAFPQSLTSIEGWAFWHTNLSSIYIPQNVSFIADRTFSPTAQTIEVDKNNKYYDSRDKCNAIIETSSNTLLSGCANTKIPNTISAIGDWAFDQCSGLSEIEIPSNVKAIGLGAFSHCRNLHKVKLSDGLKTIGEIAFRGTSITSIVIPPSVISIGINNEDDEDGEQSNPFCLCSKLTSIRVDGSNPHYDSRNNCNAIIETLSNKLITGCYSTVIPDNIVSIESEAFAGSSIESIVLPKNLKSIDCFAFKTWGNQNCDNLKKIVSYIEEPTKEHYSMGDKSSTILYVPKGTKKKYEQLPMWKYDNIIEMD